MKATSVLVNLPKGVKGVVNLDLHINGEWVKEINPGRMTVRQMVKAVAKTAKETNGEHVQVFMYFDCLCIGEVVCTGAGVEVRIYGNEPTEEPTTPAQAEPSELTHAGQCLDIYLMNTAEIYERYTVPAIEACVKTQSVKTPEMWDYIKQALKAAARLVIKSDGLTPTADDIKTVTANYAAYITDCAEYQATTV